MTNPTVGFGPIGMGVIGAGVIGRLHAQHLVSRVSGARLLAVSDVVADVARSCGEANGVTAYDNHHALLADPSIDAVVIASPPDTHAALIEDAAHAGKHVFSEKPIDCTLEKIDRAVSAVQRAGVKLQTGFNRRFDANYHAAHEAVAAGKVGRPLITHIISRDPKPPSLSNTRAVGGLFLDMTIHDFDMARFVTGSEVGSVHAVGATMLEGCGEPDTALVTLRMASGALVSIDNGHTTFGYDQRIEVFGSNGMIATTNEKPHTALLTDATGSHAILPWHFFIERYAESYVQELSAFVECIVNDTQPPVTADDGRKAVVIAFAAQRSFEEGRSVAISEVE
jgi:myo-inositol 2-dehydrogenase/D-chiro-inositol 1-dehydrogenase